MAETIGSYEVLERLGSGSLGDVVRARDSSVGRTVAITLVDAALIESAQERRDFLDRAGSATTLSHSSIEALFEVGEDDGRVYLVREFVPGSTLRMFMGDRPLHPARALGLALQVADALAEGHARGLAHADVNPETIMITPTGRAKLIDYGFSRWTPGGRARAAFGAGGEVGSMLGSVAYMSPEQALGGDVDVRTDLFSLGSVLFEMLTGEAPFARAGQDSLSVQVLQRVLPGPSSLNPHVPHAVDAVLQRALMKNPDHREANVATFAADLRAIEAQLKEASVQPADPRIPRPARASRTRLWLLLLLAVLLLSAGWWWGSRR